MDHVAIHTQKSEAPSQGPSACRMEDVRARRHGLADLRRIKGWDICALKTSLDGSKSAIQPARHHEPHHRRNWGGGKFTMWLALTVLLISGSARGQAPIPKLKPIEKAEALRLFDEIRANRWGPYGTIHWYCRDGRVLAVSVP